MATILNGSTCGDNEYIYEDFDLLYNQFYLTHCNTMRKYELSGRKVVDMLLNKNAVIHGLKHGDELTLVPDKFPLNFEMDRLSWRNMERLPNYFTPDLDYEVQSFIFEDKNIIIVADMNQKEEEVLDIWYYGYHYRRSLRNTGVFCHYDVSGGDTFEVVFFDEDRCCLFESGTCTVIESDSYTRSAKFAFAEIFEESRASFKRSILLQ